MPRVKRTRYVLFYLEDQPILDVQLLLRGVVSAPASPQLLAISLLAARPSPITTEDLALLTSIPVDDWVDEPSGADGRARELARAGVLLSDADEPALADLRDRERAFAEVDWNLYGALYHLLTRWSGVELRADENAELVPPSAGLVGDFFRLRGPPPSAFASRGPPAVQLPLAEPDGPLYEVLARRRTTRSFDRSASLPLDDFSGALRSVFGIHGFAAVLGHVLTLKRSSPSAGGLHPIEVYPVVRDVEGVAPGVYHYNARDHTLELLGSLSRTEAEQSVSRYLCGQTFLASAHAHFFLAARFQRAFWKYRRHPKGYAAMLMDAAHLSQTLYLVATDLGLGAYVTAAVNGADVDARLGLDGVREGVLAACGLGVPAARPSPFDASFQPYVPRETELGGLHS